MSLIKIENAEAQMLQENVEFLNSVKTITGSISESNKEVVFEQVYGVEKFIEGEYFLIVNDFDENKYDLQTSKVHKVNGDYHIDLKKVKKK